MEFVGIEGKSIEVSERLYVPSKEIEEHKREEREEYVNEKKKNKRYFNGRNNRLNNVTAVGGKEVYHVEGVMYEDDIKLAHFYRETIHRKGKRDEFLESKIGEEISNQMGSGGVIKTVDGYYLFRTASKQNSTYNGELQVSFGGSMNSLTTGTFQDNLPLLVFRELEEELGVNKRNIKRLEFLGTSYDECTLGKPEMVWLVELDITKEEVLESFKTAKDNWESAELIFVKSAGELKNKGYQFTAPVNFAIKYIN